MIKWFKIILLLCTITTTSMAQNEWSNYSANMYYNNGKVSLGTSVAHSDVILDIRDRLNVGGTRAGIWFNVEHAEPYQKWFIGKNANNFRIYKSGIGDIMTTYENGNIEFCGVNRPLYQFQNILTKDAFFRMSNGTNWGLMIRSDINDPKIGAWDRGTVQIYPYASATGGLNTTKNYLASFNFDTMTAIIQGDLEILNKNYLQHSAMVYDTKLFFKNSVGSDFVLRNSGFNDFSLRDVTYNKNIWVADRLNMTIYPNLNISGNLIVKGVDYNSKITILENKIQDLERKLEICKTCGKRRFECTHPYVN